MNKYNEIEIETAKNLLKKGYKWIARNKSGKLFVYSVKPHKADRVWYPMEKCGYVCKEFVPIFQNVRFGDKEPVSLEAIVNPQILDDVERRYLSAVIRPFRDKVLHIRKGSLACNEEYISIHFRKCDFTCLPNFKRGTMYKGMEPDRRYTLEELGL